MKHSESIKNIAAALLKAQAEMENAHKNANNPAFRSKYADLAEILATVKPVLTKHGVTLLQSPGFADGLVTLDTMLMHPDSGEWIRGEWASPISKSDPQGVGSATTYGRRYSLAAICGIAQEDDDGSAASQPSQRQEVRGAPLRQEPVQLKPVGVQHTNAPDILDQELTFGKMKGRTWGWLVQHDPSYVEWAIAKMERLAPEARDYLKLALAERAMQPVGDPADDLSQPEPDLLPF